MASHTTTRQGRPEATAAMCCTVAVLYASSRETDEIPFRVPNQYKKETKNARRGGEGREGKKEEKGRKERREERDRGDGGHSGALGKEKKAVYVGT